jgi:hypothetical protein
MPELQPINGSWFRCSPIPFRHCWCESLDRGRARLLVFDKYQKLEPALPIGIYKYRACGLPESYAAAEYKMKYCGFITSQPENEATKIKRFEIFLIALHKNSRNRRKCINV